MSTAVQPSRASAVAEVSDLLASKQQEFKAALPAHIPVERFLRVVNTAIQMNPQIAMVDRRSLFTACVKAATDGLLPDGREAALVIYKDKTRGEIAQYMPMVAGLRKKVRNSDEIATWETNVVYENDAFEFELGDKPFIRHKPVLSNRGKPVAAYSVATLKSGEVSREVMSIDEIEAIRKRSRAAYAGPWVTDYAEMVRKTVARRHSKVLPMSTDLDDVIRRDDALYDFQNTSDSIVKAPATRGAHARLAALSEPAAGHQIEYDDIPETTAGPAETAGGAPSEGDSPLAPSAPSEGRTLNAASQTAAPELEREWGSEESLRLAHSQGAKAKADGKNRRAMPDDYDADGAQGEANAWTSGFNGEAF